MNKWASVETRFHLRATRQEASSVFDLACSEEKKSLVLNFQSGGFRPATEQILTRQSYAKSEEQFKKRFI